MSKKVNDSGSLYRFLVHFLVHFVEWHPSPVEWLQRNDLLSADEKEKILRKNLVQLLDMK